MQLLKIEWTKIRKYRTFWILVGIFSGLYLLVNYVAAYIVHKVNSNPVKLLDESYSFPYVWNTMAYNYSWMILFICLFMIVSVANEYTFKTQRQHIIDGMHRLDFLHAKALLVLSVSVACTLFYAALCLIFGFMGGTYGIFDHAYFIVYVFIHTLNILSFTALLALFIKRSGLSIIIFLAYLILETGIAKYINFRFETQMGNLLPLQCSDELMPLRSLEKLKRIINSGGGSDDLSAYTLLGVSVVFIALYYFIARRKMLSSDL